MSAPPVPWLQHPDEFASLLALYQTLKPRRVLEVGSWHGGTLYHWLRHAQRGSIVVSLDRYWDVDNSAQYGDWASDGVEIVVIRGDSNDPRTVAHAAAYAPYDFVFVDADHHEPNVRADWRHYSQLAAPGAVIALHDILESDDPTIEVAPLWAELRHEHATIEFAAAGGYGIGVVFLPPRPPVIVRAGQTPVFASVSTATMSATTGATTFNRWGTTAPVAP